MRVALAEVPWPVPKRPRTRDELQLGRTLSTFRVVRARPGLIVARRGGLRIVFRQVEPHRAALLFRRGKLDEAPVALGDIRAAQRDPLVGPTVRVTHLDEVDGLRSVHLPRAVRETLSATADRRDYAQLVPEDLSAEMPTPPARVFRAARAGVHRLVHVPVRIRAVGDPSVYYGATMLAAAWRDLDLDVHVVGRNANALFTRSSAPAAVAIARAVDARLVSPRVQGWRENTRGIVDYARVKLR
jgi:hypothetical protein